MNYKKRFALAWKKTTEIGLFPGNQEPQFEKEISRTKTQEILQFCCDALYERGYESSSDLAGDCIPIHLGLQALLKERLGVESYITIGDRYWDDYTYCEMSYESIVDELKSPSLNSPIKAHVWLTLADGKILDCTAEAHADIIFNRGFFPTEKCLMLVPPEKEEDSKAGYHRPYVIGVEYLKVTGAFNVYAAHPGAS